MTSRKVEKGFFKYPTAILPPQLTPPPQAEHCCTLKSPFSLLWRASDSREVLQNNSCRLKWHFHILVLHHFPVENILNISFLHQELVAVTDCCFQEDSNGKGQASCIGKRQETNPVFTLGHMSPRTEFHAWGSHILTRLYPKLSKSLFQPPALPGGQY